MADAVATADHERPPLPLSLVGWGVTVTMFAFGAWGYAMRGGFFSGEVDASSAGFALLAALSLVLQIGAAFGAKAVRRSKSFDLSASKVLSAVLVVGGGVVTGCAVHNALEVAGMDALTALLIAVAVPIVEFSVWWVDESLTSEAAARCAADDAKRLSEAQARSAARNAPPPGPLGFDPASFDFAAASDESIDRVITMAASLKKLGENERGRRRQSSTPVKSLRFAND